VWSNFSYGKEQELREDRDATIQWRSRRGSSSGHCADASINAEDFYTVNDFISEAPGRAYIHSGARMACVLMRSSLMASITLRSRLKTLLMALPNARD
jgi:hypothetical protein